MSARVMASSRLRIVVPLLFLFGGCSSPSSTPDPDPDPIPSRPAPTVSLAATPTSVVSGAGVELSWSSTDADSCVASGDWSGEKLPSGSETVTVDAEHNTFTITCTTESGSDERSVTVTVLDPPPPPLPPPGDGPSDPYATTFDGAENPIDENGTWINGKLDGVDWNNVQVGSLGAHASALSGDPSRYNDSIARLNTTYSADQYAEGTVYRDSGYDPAPSKHEVELLLHFEISANTARGYEVLWGISGYFAVVRWNGPLGSYTPIIDTGDPGIGAPADGDVLRAEIRGNVITVYKNGEQVAEVDVTSIGGTTWTSGQPGIGFWPVDAATIDRLGWKRYEAGSLGG